MRIALSPIGDPYTAQLFVGGMVFNLEHKTGNLYPQLKPEQIISFKGNTSISGYYTAVFDTELVSLKNGTEAQSEWEKVIRFPEILFNGPIKDNALLNQINEQSFQHDFGFVITNETIKNRLDGNLVILDLAGDKYFVDVVLNQLRSVKNFMIQLNLNDFNQFEDRNWGWYDVRRKQLVDIDADSIIRTPKHVYHVQFSELFNLDPIGFAGKEDFGLPVGLSNSARYINYVLMEVEPKAYSQHVSETPIASNIADNRKRRGLPPEKARVVRSVKLKGRGLNS
jgi:hypothetical protein